MKRLNLICVFALIMIFSAYAQTSELRSKTNDGWKSFTENNYSINYPGTWELDQSGQMGMSFILLSPPSSEQDQFRENVNLLIQDLTVHNLDLDSYTELSLSQIKTMFGDGNLIDSRRLGSEKLDHHKVVYTGTQGIFNLKFEQYYWVINQKAYVLTLTCEESAFSEYQLIGEKILNSFIVEFN